MPPHDSRSGAERAGNVARSQRRVTDDRRRVRAPRAGTMIPYRGRETPAESTAPRRCERLVAVLLGFAARNPGIARVLMGDALVGEHERLRARVGQFFERCETQLRQVLNQYELDSGQRLVLPASASANLLLAYSEGRMAQFLRSEFRSHIQSILDKADGLSCRFHLRPKLLINIREFIKRENRNFDGVSFKLFFKGEFGYLLDAHHHLCGDLQVRNLVRFCDKWCGS